MEVSRFSLWQHLIDPFHVPGQGEGKKVEVLDLREKVQVVALAILAACIAVLLPQRWTFVVIAGTAFYALTAYHKVSYCNRSQETEEEEGEAEAMTDEVEATAQDEEPAPPPSPVASPKKKEKKEEAAPSQASVESAKEEEKKAAKQEETEVGDFVLLPSTTSGAEEAKDSSVSEEAKSAVAKIVTFFETMVEPHLKAIAAKTTDVKLCFVKNDSAPVTEWLKKEYKVESIQKNNFLFLKEKHPEIDQGIFISIRGDCDCTFRSIGTGLLLQSLSAEGDPAPKAVFEQCKSIMEKLQKQSSDLLLITKALQDEIGLLRREAQQSEDSLSSYREADERLNDEGQHIKATLDEKRVMADILDEHLKKFQETENQAKIQKQIQDLESVYKDLNQLVSPQFAEKKEAKEISQATIELMNQEAFDKAWIQFLRKAAVLHLIFNMEKMEGYIKQLHNQEKVTAGEISMFDLLLQRADAQQPNEEHLQGSVNEAQSLSMLFDQSLHWYRCEVKHEPKDRMIYSFGLDKSDPKKPFFILNRPGHSDLILI